MSFPALPLWTDAYIGDTDHLTFTEHGVYLRLLMLIWRTPGCRIPNDKNWIMRRLRTSEDEYENLVKPIIEEFCQSTGNYVTQKRLQSELEYVKGKSKKQSDRAKSRWNKEKGECHGNATPHTSGNAPTPTPTPIRKEERKNAPTSVVATVEVDEKKALIDRAINVLGGTEKSARSLCGRLVKAKGGSIELARAAIEVAATKVDARQYIGGVIRQNNGTKLVKADGVEYDPSHPHWLRNRMPGETPAACTARLGDVPPMMKPALDWISRNREGYDPQPTTHHQYRTIPDDEMARLVEVQNKITEEWKKKNGIE